MKAEKLDKPDNICPRPDRPVGQATQPLASAIYPTSVWICNDTAQAEELLGGGRSGYVYQRDRHPNADALAEKLCQLHGAEQAAITSSGMAAMAAAVLSHLRPGDHALVSNQLYGRSLLLLTQELPRLGIASTAVDTCDLDSTRAAMTDQTRLVVAETISNPCLSVGDIAGLARLAHERDARLLIDNTFATPVLCQPLSLGGDMVLESVSKMINGHSDVMLGALLGRQREWDRVPLVSSAWGLASSPFDAWLALRGLATLHLRMSRACQSARLIAEFLSECPRVQRVDYPGLTSHPQHELAKRQFQNQFGSMVTFHLAGGRKAADAFIAAAKSIPFCPSLGEACTTLSHPESTSHRGLSREDRLSLGITGGTVRLSVGIEDSQYLLDLLRQSLNA